MSHLSHQVSYQYTYNRSCGCFGIQLQVVCDILQAQAQPLRGHFPKVHMYTS